jgi:hypothetical protein
VINSFAVTASLTAVDEISPILLRLSERFRAIDEQIAAMEKRFASLGASFGTGVGAKADTMAAGVTAAMERIDAAVGVTMGRVRALGAEMASVGAGAGRMTAGGVAAAEGGALAAAGGGRTRLLHGGGGGGAGGRGPINVWGGPGVGLPGGGEAHVSHGSDAFWPFAGAAVLGYGVEKTLAAGGELEKEKQLLRQMGGISESEITRTVRMAQADTRTLIGSTIAGNVRGMREMMGVMPNLETARETYPGIYKAAKVLERLEGTPAEKSIQTLAKMIELRGGGIDPLTHELSPERFASEAGSAIKMIVGSGGFINAPKALQLMQQAGPMARMQEDADTFYQGIMTAVMDMSGNRAGTALTAVGRQLLGGQMTAPKAEEMARLGLLPPAGPTTWHKSGVGVYVAPGALLGEAEIKDPLRGIAGWMRDVLTPAMKAHGYTSNADTQQELYRLFGTETGRRMAGLYLQNEAQIQRDAELYRKVNPDMAYQGIAAHDYGANLQNLGRSIENFGQAVGSPSVGAAIGYMRAISAVLNSIGGAAAAHPDVTQGAVGAAAAGTVGLFGLGASKLLGSMFRWLLPGTSATVGAGARWLGGAATGLSDVVLPFLGAGVVGGGPLALGVGTGVYAASRLSSPEGARGMLAQPDSGEVDRLRRFQILNPTGGLGSWGGIGPSGLGPGSGGRGGGAMAIPAPQVNVSAPVVNTQVNATVTLDGAAIAAHIATSVISRVTAAVASSIGNAMHLGNQTNQGPAGGAYDSPSASGVGHN